MMKILFLSCQEVMNKTGEEIDDDQLLIRELQKDHHAVTIWPWDEKTNWREYELVLIRTTWDYATQSEKFLQTLKEIAAETKLLNTYDVVKWNIHKGYLKDLESRGIPILPTIMFNANESLLLPREWGHSQFVIKPAISATAYKTMILSRSDIENESYKNALIPGDWLCQPFMPQISEGEISLLYFDKKFSHALLKTPKPGDFRVQVEWGGSVTPYTPSEELLELGHKIMDSVPHDLLYARVDVIPFEGSFALMELELIEPALYFRTHPKAAQNFSKAIKHVKKN